MFRGTGNSEMNVKHMGIGSKLNAESDLLIVQVEHNTVNLLHMQTFNLVGTETVVEDVHHISQDELRNCISKFGYCFSDFSFDPKGMKRG